MGGVEHNRLLRGLTGDELRWLESFWKEARVSAGTQLLTIGKPNERLYLLDEGVVRLSRRALFLPTTFVEEVQAGRFFGESSVLDGQPSLEDAVAVTEVRLRYFRQASLLEILSSEHRAAQQILRNLVAFMVGRLREMDERLASYAGDVDGLQRYLN